MPNNPMTATRKLTPRISGSKPKVMRNLPETVSMPMAASSSPSAIEMIVLCLSSRPRPTNIPSRSPTSISASVFHVSRTTKPWASRVRASMPFLVAEQRFERTLGHDDVERDFEREEHDQREQEAREERLPPRDPSDDSH